jgi:PEP-CTERM putative exosortase interaction domain
MTRLRFAGADPTKPPVGFIYEEGSIGTGHPIDQGITFPFTTNELTLFLGFVTSFDKANVVDSTGTTVSTLSPVFPPSWRTRRSSMEWRPPPAVPEPASLVLLGFGVAGVAVWKHRRRRDRRDSIRDSGSEFDS